MGKYDLAFSKPKHLVSPDHLDHVRKLRCLVCGVQNPDAHHLEAGGMGSDFSVIPLCREHHSEYHQIGKRAFNEKYDLDCWRECWKIVTDIFV